MSTQYSYSIIPIHLRGMYLDAPKMVASPLADFSKLPYNDGATDINFSQPFIGDGIIHHPFSNQNLLLPAGFHIHFILPHFLGQQVPKNALPSFNNQLPAAPNRWLISNGNNTWIIESDYVHDKMYTPSVPTSIIPYMEGSVNNGLPYRYMGRTSLVGDNRSAGNTFKSLNNNKPLTSAGYGDPKFSSFYPNCLGVFGFIDAAPAVGNTYKVLGWNADSTDDILLNSVQSNVDEKDIQQFIKNNFKVDIGETITTPNFRTLYYGEINFDSKISECDNPAPKVEIAIGNTGTEALSAMVANVNTNDANSKQKVEEQLESILLLHKFTATQIDIGAKFIEARHEKGFKTSHSGHIWKISAPKQTHQTASDENDDLPELPISLAKALHELNIAQHNFDQANHQLITLQQQLYHDWFKYMIAAYPPLEGRGQYPDPDHLRYFIEQFSFAEIQTLQKNMGGFTINETTNTATPDATNANDLATIFCNKYNAVISILTAENITRATANQSKLLLTKIAGPRFWEPTQPVVLISGLQMTPFDEDIPLDPTYLNANIVSSSFNPVDLSNVEDILTTVNAFNAQKYSTQIWNPFILDWQVSLMDANFQTTQGAFDTSAIQHNFSLHQFSPDLKKNNFLYGNVSVFSGSSIMSTSSRQAMLVQLRKFIEQYIQKNGISFNQNPQNNNVLFTLDDFVDESDSHKALDKINPNGIDTSSTAPLFSARNAYFWLCNNKVITQTLSGFNSASIMLRKSAQLPISEPLGFADAKAFSKQVAALVGNHKDTSPIVAFDFNPIRSGKMTLNRLSLIDNFGVATELPVPETPVVAETMKDETGNIFLNPRLVQASRLNFRWLSAEPIASTDDDFVDQINNEETNDHPHTSPICGWVLANYFNDGNSNANSLEGEANILGVYDKDGQALGYLDGQAKWNILPWQNEPCDLEVNIKNDYLRNTVKWLMQNFATNFADFIKTTQIALDNIAPAHSTTYDTKAIMMGRPIAVVRSRVSLQLKGKPVIDQSWPSTLMDITNCDNAALNYNYDSRNTNNWPSIKFPIRIGEHCQLNDGVVAYWTEDENGDLIKLYATETTNTDISNTNIDAFNGSNQLLWRSVTDAPMNITMLMDPRGLAHATCGILPTKAISIPPQHYVKAMRQINMWFAISPLLQPSNTQNELFMTLPPIPGYEWQWWDKFNGSLKVADDEATKNLHQQNQLIEGWLILNPIANS